MQAHSKTRKKIFSEPDQLKEVLKDSFEKAGDFDVDELIRSLQRLEDNPDCFNTIRRETCGEADCAWSEYCFKKNGEDSKD